MQRWVRLAIASSGLALLAAGCGMTQRLAVGSMVPVLENTAAAARERGDVKTVGEALPANLLLLDGLIRTDPRNVRLLSLGAFLYFGYALGWVEAGDPELASHYYATGRDYGLRALERHDDFRKGTQGNVAAFQSGLASLGKSDVPALAWTGANWARWLSLNLDSPAAIAEVPRIEALLDRLLELDPGFERGLPHALRGSYDALRPQLFGGDPERARREFEAALQISQRRMLLYLVFYAEFYCRQVLDEECFVRTLDEVAAAPDTLLPEQQLLNAIGRALGRAATAAPGGAVLGGKRITAARGGVQGSNLAGPANRGSHRRCCCGLPIEPACGASRRRSAWQRGSPAPAARCAPRRRPCS